MTTRRLSILWIFISMTMGSCLIPHKAYFRSPVPQPPDYADKANWAALPDRKDSADALAGNLVDGQSVAETDVFFIHPTTYIVGNHWNGALSSKHLNHHTDVTTIRYQASVFNNCCRIYAPRYRQAELYAYLDKRGNARPAFDTAYADVKKAFAYYLKQYNKGRPIVIASHSQGTDHAVRLMHDFFENDPELMSRLVAAYLVGRPITPTTFPVLKPCDSASQTGCYVTWNAVRWGETQFFGVTPIKIACVNPLSWKRDTLLVPASANEGSVSFSMKRIEPNIADARCSPSGLLWVHPPHKKGFPHTRSYHLYDYNFFYMNIRSNVSCRIEAWKKKQSSTGRH
jgi:hypothetical protein